MYNNNLIGSRQLRALLIMDIVSIGIIFLPQVAIGFSGVDSWISVALSLLFSLLYSLILCFVCNKSEGADFVAMCKMCLGAFSGICVVILFYLKLVLTGGLFLRIFSEIIKNNVLDNSLMFIAFVILLACGYSATMNFQQRGRLAEILILFLTVPVILVFVVGFFNGNVENIKPVLVENHFQVVKGGFYVSLFFIPLEFLMLSAENIKKIRIDRVVPGAVAISVVILSAITFIILTRFGVADVKRQVFPTLEMIYSVELPGAFVERLEVLVLTFLMLGMFFILHSFMYFSNKLINTAINTNSNWFIIVFTALFMYAIAFVPKDIIESIRFLFVIIKYSQLFFMVFIPVLLGLILYFGGKRIEKN